MNEKNEDLPVTILDRGFEVHAEKMEMDKWYYFEYDGDELAARKVKSKKGNKGYAIEIGEVKKDE